MKTFFYFADFEQIRFLDLLSEQREILDGI